MNLKNNSNEYVEAVSKHLFELCPKTVWAAIAISFCTSGGDRLDEAEQAIVSEWQALYQAGIVPQKPPAFLTPLAADVAKAEEYFETDNIPTAAGHGYGY